MEGTVVWKQLEPYFHLVRLIHEMTEKAVTGQYGGPSPKKWFKKGAVMQKGDQIYVLAKHFREDKKKRNILSCSRCYLPVIFAYIFLGDLFRCFEF